MKVKSEDILKPGAKLEVKKTDWESPEVMAILSKMKCERAEMRRVKTTRFPRH